MQLRPEHLVLQCRFAIRVLIVFVFTLLYGPIVRAQTDDNKIFCGGLVSLENGNAVALGVTSLSDGSRELSRSTVSETNLKKGCHDVAEAVAVPNGFGMRADIPLQPSPEVLDASRNNVLTYKIPKSTVGTLGILGRELQAFFAYRKSIQIRSESMDAGLQEIRAFSGSFTSALRGRYEESVADIPEFKSRLAKEITSQRAKIAAGRVRDNLAISQAANRLNALKAAGTLTVPMGAVGDLISVLESRQRSAEIEQAVPVSHLQLPTLEDGPILGSLEGYRWKTFSAPSEIGRATQRERAKLEAKLRDAHGSQKILLQRANESLDIAEEQAASDSPNAKLNAQALIVQARSFRYAASELTKHVLIAVVGPEDTIDWVKAFPEGPYPALSLSALANNYISSSVVTSARISIIRKDLVTRSDEDRNNGEQVLAYAEYQLYLAERDYSAGRIAESNFLIRESNRIADNVVNNDYYSDDLNGGIKEELGKFASELPGALHDATLDDMADIYGDSYLRIANFGIVTGIARDFSAFGLSCGISFATESNAANRDCARLGVKFAIGVNLGAIGLLVGTFASLPAVGVFAIAVAVPVAAEYATRALIASSFYTGPRVGE